MKKVEEFVRSLALLCASVWVVIHITSQTMFVAEVIAATMCGLSALAMCLNKKFTQMGAAIAAIAVYLIGILKDVHLVNLMMEPGWIWFPETMLIMFNIVWNKEPNEKERAISMIASTWIIVSIQAIRNQVFFWDIMTPGPKGIVFAIFLGIVFVKAVSKKHRDIATALSANFMLIVYFVITWTSIPLSEVISNNFLLMVPTVTIYVINGIIETK